MANLPLIRVALYIALAVVTFVLFILCCARIHRTNNFLFYGELSP